MKRAFPRTLPSKKAATVRGATIAGGTPRRTGHALQAPLYRAKEDTVKSLSARLRCLALRAIFGLGSAFAIFASIGASTTFSQDYPGRPVRIIIGFPPGGGTDIVSRLLAPKYGEAFKQQFIVDNRPGAGGVVAAELAAKSIPDGYTIHLGTFGALVISPAIRKIPYDPIKDFAPISQAVALQNVFVVHPTLPVRSIKELIALAKSRPGALNYASSGIGGPGYLAGEMFKTMAKVDIVHVPYKGGTEGITAVVAGHIEILVGTVSLVLPVVKAGRVRVLAVTSDKRAALLPNVPTVAEGGIKGYEATNWYGMLAPSRTPRPIIERLHGATVKALNAQDVREALLMQGIEPASSGSPEEFAAYIKSETEKWTKVVKALKLEP